MDCITYTSMLYKLKIHINICIRYKIYRLYIFNMLYYRYYLYTTYYMLCNIYDYINSILWHHSINSVFYINVTYFLNSFSTNQCCIFWYVSAIQFRGLNENVSLAIE